MYNPSGEPSLEEVSATVHGSWAAHKGLYGFGYRVTFVPFGLAVPFFFDAEKDADEAASRINALCSEWGDLTGKQIKSRYAKKIMAICMDYPGSHSDGPKGKAVPVTELQAA